MSEDAKPYLPTDLAPMGSVPERLAKLGKLLDEAELLANSLGLNLGELLRRDEKACQRPARPA